MGKLLQASPAGLQQPCSPPLLCAHDVWREPLVHNPTIEQSFILKPQSQAELTSDAGEVVKGLEDQQRQALDRIASKGVFWKHPNKPLSSVFRLQHGGDVEADGNCLFSASLKAMLLHNISPQELRSRAVDKFRYDYREDALCKQQIIDSVIKNLYAPDLASGWGVHLVQEVKLLAKKSDREMLDSNIQELEKAGMLRKLAAESVYKEHCIPVDDGPSWADYMSVGGNPDDKHDIITLQYTEDGLLSVDENRDGRAAAFGDDIAIESLATEFEREIFVLQIHGADAMVDEENCIFFLPHSPRGEVRNVPVFLFMKGTGWCGAGADHYEPLVAHPAPTILPEKAEVAL